MRFNLAAAWIRAVGRIGDCADAMSFIQQSRRDVFAGVAERASDDVELGQLCLRCAASAGSRRLLAGNSLRAYTTFLGVGLNHSVTTTVALVHRPELYQKFSWAVSVSSMVSPRSQYEPSRFSSSFS